MIASPYKAKSLKGAEREVRRLRKMLAQRDKWIEFLVPHRLTLAKLASREPQFYNPLHVIEAETIRDAVLKDKWWALSQE